MKKDIWEKIFFVIGVYLFVLGITAIIYSLINPEIASFLWLCYITLIIIGLGMIFKNSFLLVLQLNIVTIPLVFWNLDLFYRYFFNKDLFGITNYLLTLNSFGNFVTLQHIYLLPLAFFALYKFKIKRKDVWIFSFVEMILIYFLSIFLTSPGKNTNCVFRSCVNFVNLEGISYSIFWFVSIFILVFITNLILRELFQNKKGS